MPFHRPDILAEVLRSHANRQPSARACHFLSASEGEESTLTFAELDLKARALAAEMQSQQCAAERAVMVYPAGLAFVVAFWGCIYSETIAVPVAWRANGKGRDNIRRVIADCSARYILTVSALRDTLQRVLEDGNLASTVTIIETDQISDAAAVAWRRPSTRADTLALLQYTSGSTLDPRGVMVTNANLLANLEVMRVAYGQDQQSVFVSWLPHFHDLGLIGMLLHAAYVGAPCVVMAPQSFLQKPVRWLRAISQYRGTITAAPNFAYELCSDRIGDSDKAGLDLRNWRVAANAAEPVRRQTMVRFIESFGPHGFRFDAFYPSYGLAEATLLVSSARFDPNAAPLEVDERELGRGRAVVATEEGHRVSLIDVGRGPGEAIVVNPDTARRCNDNEVGEIWVGGPSATQGYWGQEESAESVFRARPIDDSQHYLRTGDLGIVRNGNLYVTGRKKGIIIIGGVNYYPQEIERTALECHPDLLTRSAAAFPIQHDGTESLAVVFEVPRQHSPEEASELVSAVRSAIAQEHELEAALVVATRFGRVPKSSSGKVQRAKCRDAWLDGSLPIVASWQKSSDAARRQAGGRAVETPVPAASAADIRAWLINKIAEVLSLSPEALDTREPLARYGMTSIRSVSLSGELSDWLGRPLPATLLYDHPTIDKIAAYLSGDAPPVLPAASVRPAVPIAVLGYAGRFPGASTPEDLWTLLIEGREAITDVPRYRWSVDSLFDADPLARGKVYTRRGGFIEAVDEFDHDFFGISLSEARSLDPQQRILLQSTVEALERSGRPLDTLHGSATGVFIGICGNDYARHHLNSDDMARIDEFSLGGVSQSFAAGRIAYALGLHGPALAIDTACSSSLSAIHLAAQSLGNRECDLAIAGGVNLNLFPHVSVSLSRLRALSPGGRSKVFDAEADGYVRSEGCGVVVLKRLDDALTDGDSVRAVIAGSAMSQDGRSNGLMAPNKSAQEAVLRAAIARAGVRPDDVAYVEAHGTGTALGDPIEVAALAAVLCEGRGPDKPLLIGSLKANIGHTEAAAGIAGLIKAMLVLEHRTIPPQINISRPNPHIPWDDIALDVPRKSVSLPASNGRSSVGVSSFGLSGTNVHVVLQGPRVVKSAPAQTDRPVHVLTLSARSEAVLNRMRRRLADWLADNRHLSLADICHSQNVGRAAMDYRCAFIGSSHDELIALLGSTTVLSDCSFAGRRGNLANARLLLALTGEGPGSLDFIRELYETCTTFREAFHRIEPGGPAAAAARDSASGVLAAEYGIATLLRACARGLDSFVSDGRGRVIEKLLTGAISPDQTRELAEAGAAETSGVSAHHADGAIVLRCDCDSWHSLLGMLANLYVSGHSVDWAELDRGLPRQHLILPTYPFATTQIRYLQATPQKSASAATAFPGDRRRSPLHDAIVFETHLRSDHPVYDAHKIAGAVVLPASAHVAMAIAGALQTFGSDTCALQDVVFRQPAILTHDEQRCLQIIFKWENEREAAFEVCSIDGGTVWTTHASGRALALEATNGLEASPHQFARGANGSLHLEADDFYAALGQMGFELKRPFRWNDIVWKGNDAAYSVMRKPDSADSIDRYPLHPGLIDSLFQLVRGLFPFDGSFDQLYVPLGIARFEFFAPIRDTPARARASSNEAIPNGSFPEALTADLELFDASGILRARVQRLALKRADKAVLLGKAQDVAVDSVQPILAGPRIDVDSLRALDVVLRAAEITDLVRRVTALTLGEKPDANIPKNRPFQELGMTSLMALDLTQALGTSVGHTLPSTLLFDHPNIEALARYVEGLLFPGDGSDGQAIGSSEEDSVLSEVIDLSDSEIEAMVNREFQRLSASGALDEGSP